MNLLAHIQLFLFTLKNHRRYFFFAEKRQSNKTKHLVCIWKKMGHESHRVAIFFVLIYFISENGFLFLHLVFLLCSFYFLSMENYTYLGCFPINIKFIHNLTIFSFQPGQITFQMLFWFIDMIFYYFLFAFCGGTLNENQKISQKSKFLKIVKFDVCNAHCAFVNYTRNNDL